MKKVHIKKTRKKQCSCEDVNRLCDSCAHEVTVLMDQMEEEFVNGPGLDKMLKELADENETLQTK